MIKLIKAIFRRKPKRHFASDWRGDRQRICNCGYHSAWDWDLRKHFEDVGRVGQ